MRIVRLIYLIFTLIGIAAITAFSVVYDSFLLSIFLIFIIIMPNYFLRNYDRKKTADIIFNYTNDCDPFLYMARLKNIVKVVYYPRHKRRSMIYMIVLVLLMRDCLMRP